MMKKRGLLLLTFITLQPTASHAAAHQRSSVSIPKKKMTKLGHMIYKGKHDAQFHEEIKATIAEYVASGDAKKGLNTQIKNGPTALHVAVTLDCSECTGYLLGHNSDVCLQDQSLIPGTNQSLNETPFHTGARLGCSKAVAVLIEHTQEEQALGLSDAHGRTFIHQTCRLPRDKNSRPLVKYSDEQIRVMSGKATILAKAIESYGKDAVAACSYTHTSSDGTQTEGITPKFIIDKSIEALIKTFSTLSTPDEQSQPRHVYDYLVLMQKLISTAQDDDGDESSASSSSSSDIDNNDATSE